MDGICDNCRNAEQCDSAKTMIGIRIECSMFIPKDRVPYGDEITGFVSTVKQNNKVTEITP